MNYFTPYYVCRVFRECILHSFIVEAYEPMCHIGDIASSIQDIDALLVCSWIREEPSLLVWRYDTFRSRTQTVESTLWNLMFEISRQIIRL